MFRIKVIFLIKENNGFKFYKILYNVINKIWLLRYSVDKEQILK